MNLEKKLNKLKARKNLGKTNLTREIAKQIKSMMNKKWPPFTSGDLSGLARRLEMFAEVTLASESSELGPAGRL